MHRWFDLVMLIAVMLVGVSVLVMCVAVSSSPIAQYDEDKSVVATENGLVVDTPYKKGRELLLSLVIADEFTPYPRAIKINDSPIIQITDEWLLLKNSWLAKIYDAGGEYKLSTMLDWDIVSAQFKYDSGSSTPDYIHYILVEN